MHLEIGLRTTNMAAQKRKKIQKDTLRVKLATYLLGILLVIPILNFTVKPELQSVPSPQESGVIVAASYRNELQDEQMQQNTVTYAQDVPENKAQAPQPIEHSEHTHNTGDDVWDKLAQCESGGNWSINTGNGYYGGIQFAKSSWNAVGGSGLPSQASREEQIERAKMLHARGGWGHWPACSRALGLI